MTEQKRPLPPEMKGALKTLLVLQTWAETTANEPADPSDEAKRQDRVEAAKVFKAVNVIFGVLEEHYGVMRPGPYDDVLRKRLGDSDLD